MLKRIIKVEKHLSISTVFPPELLKGFHHSWAQQHQALPAASQLMSTQEPAGLGEHHSSGCKMAPGFN